MTTHALRRAAGCIALLGLLSSCTPPKTPDQGVEKSSDDAMVQEDQIFMKAEDVTWVDAPPVLPPGAKIAVLEGDPSKEGPFTMRIMVPANYRVPPHSHPADEHVTVISGDFAVGMGETFDESLLNALPTGSFAMMRKGMRHFAKSTNGAVVQLHGVGPWGLTYVNPADDPRNQ